MKNEIKSNAKGWNWRKKLIKKLIKKNSNQKSKDQIWYKIKWNQIIREKIGKKNQ
jgi:hypothetical protein